MLSLCHKGREKLVAGTFTRLAMNSIRPCRLSRQVRSCLLCLSCLLTVCIVLQIEVSIAVLWEGVRDDPAQVKARAEVVDVVSEIIQQVELWKSAEGMSRAMLAYTNDTETRGLPAASG